jgi:hypothetical protein
MRPDDFKTVSRRACSKGRAVSPFIAFLLCITLTGCRGGQVDEGCYWGPIPGPARLAELKAQGIRTVINCRLNPLPALAAECRRLGLNYVHIPTGLFRSPPQAGIEKFLEVAADPDYRPVYICDQVARDRVQFYAGIYGMMSQGWSARRASWQMYRNGLRHWWPWFYKYKHIVAEQEQQIHSRSFRRDVNKGS